MRRLINILLFIVLAIGCRKDNPNEMEEVEVSINLASIDISPTKTSSNPLQNGKTLRVLAYKVDNDTESLVTQATFKVENDQLVACTVDAAGEFLYDKGSNTMLLPSKGNYKFYAICPAIICDANGIVVVPTGDKELLYSKKDAGEVTPKQNIILDVLSHQHSQIVMDITVKYLDIGTADVKILPEGITFSKMKNNQSMSFNVTLGKFSSVTDPIYSPLTFINPDFLEPVTTKSSKQFISNPKTIFPKTVPSFTITFNLKIGENNMTLVTAPLERTFKLGNKYTFKLVLEDKGIGLFLVVQQWGTNNNWNSDFGGSIAYFLGAWKLEEWKNGHGVDADYYKNLVWIPASWEASFVGRPVPIIADWDWKIDTDTDIVGKGPGFEHGVANWDSDLINLPNDMLGK